MHLLFTDTTHFEAKDDTLPTVFKRSKPKCLQDILSQVKTQSNTQLSLIPNTIAISKLILLNPATTATTEEYFPLRMLAECFNSFDNLIRKPDSRWLIFGCFSEKTVWYFGPYIRIKI